MSCSLQIACHFKDPLVFVGYLQYLAWASSPGGQAASVAMVSAFSRSAVEAYMAVTEGSNFWEDMLRVLSKPEYRSFLGIECEVTTRAFVMSLFEAMGRYVLYQ